MVNHDGEPHSLVDTKIKAAKSGDTEAAKWLLNEFRKTVLNNRKTMPDGSFQIDGDGSRVPHSKPSGAHTQFDEHLLDYLADCIGEIGTYVADGGRFRRQSSDLAFNLAAFGRRGPKRDEATTAASLQRGMEVWRFRREHKVSVDAACTHLANVGDKSYDTFQRDYKLFKNALDSLG